MASYTLKMVYDQKKNAFEYNIENNLSRSLYPDNNV